jgi:hypothetical protein
MHKRDLFVILLTKMANRDRQKSRVRRMYSNLCDRNSENLENLDLSKI